MFHLLFKHTLSVVGLYRKESFRQASAWKRLLYSQERKQGSFRWYCCDQQYNESNWVLASITQILYVIHCSCCRNHNHRGSYLQSMRASLLVTLMGTLSYHTHLDMAKMNALDRSLGCMCGDEYSTCLSRSLCSQALARTRRKFALTHGLTS